MYIHTHWRGDILYANVVEKHYDAAGYDALYAVGKEILRKITKSRDPGGIQLHLLHSFGKENGTTYVKEIDPDDPNLTDSKPYVVIHYKPYEEFYSQHKEEFARRAADTVERLLGRKLTSEERHKVERVFKLAVEYGKIFHDIYKSVSEDAYDLTSAAAYAHQEEGFKSLEYAEKTLGVDFLEEVGDIILELNKIFPGFSKPEEVYGDRWYEFLKKKGIDPKTLEPIGAKPKYPETKKAVEEELRRAGIPEEKVKIVAPRLATAVWLDKWFENAAKSYTYRKLGGVPLDEIKNLRNMILAKKHVAEVAAKIMEEHWTRGNHVQITEKHVDPKLLPLVREHAGGTFEDLEKVRKRVKEGKMSVEEALLRLHLELAILLSALELVGKILKGPDNLAPNPRPLGPLDSYVFPLDRLESAREELSPLLRPYL